MDGLGGIKGTYGQRIVEAVVKTIASRLKTKAQRRDDLGLCLCEGELAIVSPEPDTRDWDAFGRELTNYLGTPIEHEVHPCSVTCRAGFASGPTEQLTSGELIENARAARSQTAPIGAPTVLAYGDGVAQAVSQAQGLAKDFGLAITRHELDLHLMP